MIMQGKRAGTKIGNCMKVMKFGGTSVGSVDSIFKKSNR